MDTFNPTSHKALLNIIEQNEHLKKELSRLIAKSEEKISFNDQIEDDEPSLTDLISDDSSDQKNQKEEVSDLIEDKSDQDDSSDHKDQKEEDSDQKEEDSINQWTRESQGIKKMKTENRENQNKTVNPQNKKPG